MTGTKNGVPLCGIQVDPSWTLAALGAPDVRRACTKFLESCGLKSDGRSNNLLFGRRAKSKGGAR